MFTRRALIFSTVGLVALLFPHTAKGGFWFALRFLGGASRLMRGARIASRASSTYSRGLRVSNAVARPRPSAPASPGSRTTSTRVPRGYSRAEQERIRREANRTAQQHNSDVTSDDRQRLARNLFDLAVDAYDLLGNSGANHVANQWEDDNNWSTIETREHIDQCSHCQRVYSHLLKGTTLAQIPLTSESGFGEALNIVGEDPSRVRPLQSLKLRGISIRALSGMRGKDLVLTVQISPSGKATVIRHDNPGFPPIVVQQAIGRVESIAWQTPRGVHGSSIGAVRRIIFRWQ